MVSNDVLFDSKYHQDSRLLKTLKWKTQMKVCTLDFGGLILDGLEERWICVDEWVDAWVDAWMLGWMHGRIGEYEWMDWEAVSLMSCSFNHAFAHDLGIPLLVDISL